MTTPDSPRWSPISPRCATPAAGASSSSAAVSGEWTCGPTRPCSAGSCTAVPIGRDVVIDVATFDMVGRKYRNLRQAVQRTQNFGVTTEVVDEQGLDDRLLAELTEVMLASPSGSRTERGFSMALDGTLEGRYPGVALIIARDKDGRVQGFHRYAPAGHGTEVTLDVPWRRRGAPNGIDERLSVDMITARERARRSTALARLRRLSGDLHRQAPQPAPEPRLHRGPSRRPADRARIALPLPTEVPRARRSAVRDGNTHAGGAAADRAVVAGVHAEAAHLTKASLPQAS